MFRLFCCFLVLILPYYSFISSGIGIRPVYYVNNFIKHKIILDCLYYVGVSACVVPGWSLSSGQSYCKGACRCGSCKASEPCVCVRSTALLSPACTDATLFLLEIIIADFSTRLDNRTRLARQLLIPALFYYDRRVFVISKSTEIAVAKVRVLSC